MAYGRPTQHADGSTQLAIKGWTKSKIAAESEDQGVGALLIFLSKKSSRNILSYWLAGRTVLIIEVNKADQDRFFHLEGFTFAGATLHVEEARNQSNRPQNQSQPQSQSQTHSQTYPRSQNSASFESRVSQPSRGNYQNGTSRPPPTGPRGQGPQNRSAQVPIVPASEPRRGPNAVTTEVENLIISVIHRRYRPAEKHLVLNALVTEPDLLNAGLDGVTPGKVYKAIFALCETKIWETQSKRDDSVSSVSLRDNGIKSVQDIISLASTFPRLQNLDLANNSLEDLGALKFWKNQFRDLEHLILTGNPIASKPDTLSTLLQWYPKLKLYNSEPVRGVAANPTQPFGTGVLQSTQPHPTPTLTPFPPQQPQAGAPPATVHPELPANSSFGAPLPDKPDNVLLREQMGLQFSFETKLKLQWVENCLSANSWDYATAMANFTQLKNQGQIPADAYLAGV